MAKMVKTFKSLEAAKQAADAEFAKHGWFVAVVPVYGKEFYDVTSYMLLANSTLDMVYSVGQEETE